MDIVVVAIGMNFVAVTYFGKTKMMWYLVIYFTCTCMYCPPIPQFSCSWKCMIPFQSTSCGCTLDGDSIALDGDFITGIYCDINRIQKLSDNIVTVFLLSLLVYFLQTFTFKT